jgi:hypothetical protein
VLFNVRILLDFLSSSSWTWTVRACEELLALLDLQEVGSQARRRDFKSAPGLTASLQCLPDGSPSKIEFPFPVDPALQEQGMAERYVDLVASPVMRVLGEPTTDSPAAPSWTLHGTILRVELQEDASPPVVALVLERHVMAEGRAS